MSKLFGMASKVWTPWYHHCAMKTLMYGWYHYLFTCSPAVHIQLSGPSQATYAMWAWKYSRPLAVYHHACIIKSVDDIGVALAIDRMADNAVSADMSRDTLTQAALSLGAEHSSLQSIVATPAKGPIPTLTAP